MLSKFSTSHAFEAIEQIASQHSIEPHRGKDAEALHDAEILRRHDACADGADQHHGKRHGGPDSDASDPPVPAPGDDQPDQRSGLEAKAVKSAGEVDNEVFNETVAALVMLGFQKGASEKVVKALLKEDPNIQVEDAVRLALRRM